MPGVPGVPGVPGPISRLLRRVAMPLLALLMVGGVAAHQGRYETAAAYDQYHARCRAAVAAIPSGVGHWLGRDVPLPQPALDLLVPNALRHVRYTDFSPAALVGPDRRVSLILVQCKLAKDMLGHYPPRCYPAHGARLLSGEPRTWDVGGGLEIEGVEYAFAEPERGDLGPAGLDWSALGLGAEAGQGGINAAGMDAAGFDAGLGGRRQVVMCFFVVPGAGVARDMDAVEEAAADYRQRHRGAAQVQVVFDASAALPPRREREAIFAELVGAAMPAIRAIADEADSDAPNNAVAGDVQPVGGEGI